MNLIIEDASRVYLRLFAVNYCNWDASRTNESDLPAWIDYNFVEYYHRML